MFNPRPTRLGQAGKPNAIEVFDKTNKNRLLGVIKTSCELNGMVFEMTHYGSLGMRPTSLRFDVDFMQESKSEKIGPNTRKITTIEQKVLLTNYSLEKLMNLVSFYLPGESDLAQKERRRSYGYGPVRDSDPLY